MPIDNDFLKTNSSATILKHNNTISVKFGVKDDKFTYESLFA